MKQPNQITKAAPSDDLSAGGNTWQHQETSVAMIPPATPLREVTFSERLIDKAELLSMVPYTIQHIYRLEKAGQFPGRVHVGANRVAWLHSEIVAWIKARIDVRRLS